MKKIFLLFSFIVIFMTNAQVSSYSFVKSTGTYTALTGSTILGTATANTIAGSLDNTIYPVALPFNFSFNGVNYSSLNVSTNGFVTFGATAPSGSEYSPISSATAYSGAISAFGRDLNSFFNIASTTGEISWGVVGTAPNREIVIQWSNFRPVYTTSTTNVYAFSFQIRLKETSNIVAIVYKSGSYLAGTTSISNTAQIGLRGTSNADFNNRTNSTTVLFSNSTAGTANNNTQAFNTTAATPGMPANGLTYTWTPPTCFGPSGLTSSSITSTGAVISWTASTSAPANGYAYYLTTTNTPPAVGATPTGTTTGTTVNLASTLTPNTTYYWWVRAICSSTDSSPWGLGATFTTTQIPATLPYLQPFTTNDFGFVNADQENKWYHGSVTGNPSNAIYISNDNGATNAYSSVGAGPFVVQAYRDFTIPAGTTAASPAILSFDWKAEGESSFDYLRVWLVPASFMPTAGTQITAGTGRVQIGQFNQESTWQNYINTNVNLAAYAGSTMRLVFEWRNDVSVENQPPAAVDNISLLIPTCKVPTALAVTGVVSNGATISWTAPTPAPANGYAYYISTSNVPPTGAPTGTTTATSVNLVPTLVPNTTYYWWVRAVCSSTDSSIWIPGPSFMTTQIPAVLPYLQNFETANDLGLLNGTQTNKWFYGSATGNTGKSLYISNDNGVTNAYTLTSTSTVQVYRDIQIPAGTSLASFSFDWKAAGDSLDYLRVWLVPSTYLPTPGTQITAGTGRVQIGQYNQNGTTWQSYSNANLNLTNFAGTTMRLVFEWRNSASGGTQPPAAVDNIVLRVCSTATPTVTVTNIAHNSATITWLQDTGGASYKIRYRPVGSTQWLPAAGPIDVAAVPGTTQTFTLNAPNNPLTPATLYEVEVAAVCNTINVGVYSHNEFTTKCDPTPPNVTFTNITSTSAVVNWSPIVASATYQMQWRKVGDPGWSLPIDLPNPPANTTYLLSGLTPYTQYEVQVRSTCVGSTTPNPWSSLSRFTTERTCEIPPPGLTILELKPTSAKVQWDPYVGPDATGKYILRYRKVGIPGWTNVPVSTNLYTLTGLTELTKYEMQVANVCSGTPGNYTLPYYFTTPTVIYCQMGANTASGEYISQVTVTPNGKPQMKNPSGASQYTDYTALSTAQIELIQGSVNNQLTVDKAVTGDAGVVAWIDFDRNGEFDINERILVSGPNTAATATATFSVPSDAFVSNVDYMYVVMRVALMKGGLPVNCTKFDNGEVEDYTVRITKKPTASLLNQTDILIYPNPVSTVLNVKNISKRANYKIYNAAGQLISSGIILNNKIDVHSLINGVYMIDIEDGSTSVQKKFIKE
ncbi:fibronectin type III domain-containing protein [Chryseobacterium camelliae]|uniref:Fibronectin type III domain-containing protein n=1 Tax=Chryseobacterium camelliae TaxID=1265445 RepID=A0ABY7QSZ3_9FLAO|nr:fibronectin type III domain-containing protein [Chryseobacterium camelliae]WBV61886.1 fibronectin type III domain-containing protein [Chryseobacterium camelliae]